MKWYEYIKQQRPKMTPPVPTVLTQRRERTGGSVSNLQPKDGTILKQNRSTHQTVYHRNHNWDRAQQGNDPPTRPTIHFLNGDTFVSARIMVLTSGSVKPAANSR